MSTQLSQVDKAAKKDKYQGHIAQINIEDFTSDSFRVDEYISQLAAPVLTGRSTERPGGVSPSVPEVKRILAYFERCEKDIVRLEKQVDFKVECLQRDLAREESAYQVQVSRLEIGWDAVQEQFSDLENRITSATQAATKIGNRLQSAEQHRVRSLDAMEQLQYLQEFAHARDPSTLSQTFHQQARMAHAAAITSKLLGVANDLISSRERVGLGEAPPVPKQPGSSPQRAAAPALGSIENAVEQLELYRNVLENRVVSRFDDALARGELVTMADCADIMAEFPRGETVLVQRYISTRPMFTSLRELQFGAGAVAAPSQGSQEQAQQAAGVAQRAGQVEAQAGAGAASTAADQQAAGMASLRGLSSLYKGILSTMRDEAVVMEQVFPSPQRALRMFIQRIFEQRVGTALSAALRPPGRDAGHAALQVHLNVLAEAYRKTQALASELQDVSGCEVVDQVEAVFSQVLNDYPAQELRWLALLYDAKLKQRAAQQALSMELVLDFLAMNEEAVSRCVVLSPAPLLAANLRQLFHSSTHKVANTGCLLEQVASHLILGLTATVEVAGKALLGPFQPASVLHKAQEPGQQGGSANPAGAAQSSGSAAGTGVQGGVQPGGAGGPGSPSPASYQLPSRSTIRQAAQLSLSGSLAAVLQAVDVVGGMALAVQRHYTRVILPHVEGSGTDAKACAAGLAALIKAASDRVLAALQRMLTLLFNQVDLTLVAEQKRGDFHPGEQDPPPSFELPTPACLVVTELLEAAAQLADTHLHGANRKAFHGEMGRRLLRTLQLHMARFTYSPMGALRWKRDVSEYEACCRKSLHLPEGGALLQQMEELQNSLNLLVVPPESLLSLVDANLRMSHAAALKVIQLREDFRSVRVGGGKTPSLLPCFLNPDARPTREKGGREVEHVPGQLLNHDAWPAG